jgi:hypothetical protein
MNRDQATTMTAPSLILAFKTRGNLHTITETGECDGGAGGPYMPRRGGPGNCYFENCGNMSRKAASLTVPLSTAMSMVS